MSLDKVEAFFEHVRDELARLEELVRPAEGTSPAHEGISNLHQVVDNGLGDLQSGAVPTVPEPQETEPEPEAAAADEPPPNAPVDEQESQEEPTGGDPQSSTP